MAFAVSHQFLWTTLLIVHGLLAVALLGALTHQFSSALRTSRPSGSGFLARFSSVPPARYTDAICILWVLGVLLGGFIYAEFRIRVRIPMEQQEFFMTLGAFELKEHLAVLGMALLPLYRLLWKPETPERWMGCRLGITAYLTAVCWYSYLAGHVVNNVMGMGL